MYLRQRFDAESLRKGSLMTVKMDCEELNRRSEIKSQRSEVRGQRSEKLDVNGAERFISTLADSMIAKPASDF